MNRYAPVILLAAWLGGAVDTADATWPMLHGDYQRSGWTDEIVRGPYERKWYRDFHDEMIATRVEAIIAEGKCYVGTFAGNLYALDVTDGRTIWTFKGAGPIGASPCYSKGRLFVGADVGFDTGYLYCVDANDGSMLWRYKAGAGIWTSPACDGQRVYFGDRAGVFHAISAAHGESLWSFSTGEMILKPASFSLDHKKIVVGSEDMYVYCFDPAGKLLWKSGKLQGLSMRDQGPTIWDDLAIVRTNPADSFHTVLGRNGDLLKQIQLSLPKTETDKVLMNEWGNLIMHPTAQRRQAEQDGIIVYLRDHRYDQCFYAMSLEDGNEPWIAPVFYTCGLHNPPTPPTFDPRTNELYTFCRSALTYHLRGVRSYNALGRINRKTGRIDFYWPEERNRNDCYALALIGDETQSLSMMGRMLISNHQGMLGGLELETMKVVTIWDGRDTYGGIFGPAAVAGSFEGAERLALQGRLTGMPNEWHGPDRSVCAIAQDRMFWVVGSQVVCIAGPDVPRSETGGTKPPSPIKSKLPWCVAGGNVASKGGGAFDEKVEKIIPKPGDMAKYVANLPPALVQQDKVEPANALRSRLDAQIVELITGGPWAPFVVELGISGEERHFWRTAETMQIVSLALPHLSESTKAAAVTFLDRMFDAGMPLTQPIHSGQGNRREPYDLGPGAKQFAESKVTYQTNIEDIYALWAYAHYADRWDKVLGRLDAITTILDEFAGKEFKFEHGGTHDEAEHLNCQIAGVLAAARIFAKADQSNAVDKATELLAKLVTERVHHERADGWLIRPTHVASKGLHQAKVPRYVGLVPELSQMLREYADEHLTRNVRALTTGLPVWYQAYGERMIGGENYISPPHLARGLFAVLAEGVAADRKELAAKLDQPWCTADLYYIEKLSATLRQLN